MEKNKPIAQLRVNDETEGFYILRGAYPKTTAAGKPFLSAVLADRTGEIEAKVWDYGGPIGEKEQGKAVKIRGIVTEYRGAKQLNVERIRLAGNNDDIDVSALVPTAPIDSEAAWEELGAIVESISDADYRAVCRLILERHGEKLRSIPAAKSVHHAFRSGLLMHTLNMLRAADFFAAMYADTLDRSLLIAGTLLHDIGKRSEFDLSEFGLVSDYSVKGELLGHLVMGAQEAAEAAKELGIPEEKSVLLQHMILSHHGEPEFGAAVRPMCAESELLSELDKLDSRMEIYREALSDLNEGEFSQRIFALDKKIYRHGGIG
ncbi:MAG: HD domain-containing protein [Oscillospiraceae bacterium]|nr:HD domain-containing protein [Oscillospiraceae bacterium]